jgi:hypothetical protein
VLDLENKQAKTVYVTPFLDQKASITDLPTDDILWYSQDAVNSTRILLNDSGNISEKFAYSAFGAPLSFDDVYSQRFMFMGREIISANHSHVASYRNRVYADNRWISRDPIGYFIKHGRYI